MFGLYCLVDKMLERRSRAGRVRIPEPLKSLNDDKDVPPTEASEEISISPNQPYLNRLNTQFSIFIVEKKVFKQ